jgi:hypothetical protein
VKLREPASILLEDATAEIRNLLANDGPLESLWLHEDLKSLKQRATATYRHQKDALAAIESLTGKVVEAGKLDIQGITKIKFNVPKKIANNLKSGFLDCWPQAPELDKTTRVYVSDEDINKQSTTIRIEALGRSRITATSEIRANVKRLLNGFIPSGPDGAPIWHPFFATPETLSHLANLSNINGGYIRRESQKERLLLYGDINFILKAEMGLLKSQGELNGTKVPTEPVAGDCVVCWTEATDPLQMPCTHIYCKDCFRSQANSGSIPLKCCGDENACPHTFNIAELKKNISVESLDGLLLKSFKEYISARPTEYRYCPTPDCKSIYRPIVDPNTNNADILYFCNACLSDICTFCNTPSHPGITCAEHKQVEDTKALEEYKAANGTKVCPSCKTLFEKKDGCNHITCIGCQIHICWVCLGTFQDPGACYAHLNAVHGGNGLDVNGVDINGDRIHNLVNGFVFGAGRLREIERRRIMIRNRLENDAGFRDRVEHAIDARDYRRAEAIMGEVLRGVPIPPELRFDHVQPVGEAPALPHDAPVEREAFPARAFGGPPPPEGRFGREFGGPPLPAHRLSGTFDQAAAEAEALPHDAPV